MKDLLQLNAPKGCRRWRYQSFPVIRAYTAPVFWAQVIYI